MKMHLQPMPIPEKKGYECYRVEYFLDNGVKTRILYMQVLKSYAKLDIHALQTIDPYSYCVFRQRWR